MSLFKKEKCPYCGSSVKKVDAKVVGNYDGRMALVCSSYWKGEHGETIPDNLLADHSIIRKCDAYSLCHRPDSIYGNANQPMGKLSNGYLRGIHRDVGRIFHQLWTKGILNDIWDFVLAYKLEDGQKLYAKRVKQDGEFVVIKFFDGGKMMKVPRDKTDTIDHKTKAYLWLIEQLKYRKNIDYSYKDFNLKNMEEEELIDIYNIINETIENYERNDQGN